MKNSGLLYMEAIPSSTKKTNIIIIWVWTINLFQETNFLHDQHLDTEMTLSSAMAS